MLLPWVWWHDTICMLGFMLYHVRWMLGLVDMYARCMMWDRSMIRVCGVMRCHDDMTCRLDEC